MKEITAILLGAGDRGTIYARYGIDNPGKMKIVAVAEPIKEYRERIATWHNIPPEMCFDDYRPLLEKGKIADCAIIATQDNMHYNPTIRAIDLEYDILLEKPISPSLNECLDIAKKADERGVIFALCYVLRYTQFFRIIKKLIDDGKIGKLISIQYAEDISFWHFAHSFVRGNWRNSKESSPLILAKSCHDMDILNYLAGANPSQVFSFGDLTHFNGESAPLGSGTRCNDCSVRNSCSYDATRFYLKDKEEKDVLWPTITISPNRSLSARAEALRTGPYGKCVYRCDNDVVDNQICAIKYENGVTASFALSAFTKKMGRQIKIMGSHGEIVGYRSPTYGLKIKLNEFKDYITEEEVLDISPEDTSDYSGNKMLMDEFTDAVRMHNSKKRIPARNTIMSHVLAVASEKSRIENRVVNINEYK